MTTSSWTRSISSSPSYLDVPLLPYLFFFLGALKLGARSLELGASRVRCANDGSDSDNSINRISFRTLYSGYTCSIRIAPVRLSLIFRATNLIYKSLTATSTVYSGTLPWSWPWTVQSSVGAVHSSRIVSIVTPSPGDISLMYSEQQAWFGLETRTSVWNDVRCTCQGKQGANLSWRSRFR